ncbi:MAG: DUF6476 family protein [Pseudomonadota bacterium]
MPEAPEDQELPRDLKFLRTLVTVLTATMILGVLAIVALLVIRLQAPSAPPPWPDQISLPDGVRPLAVTRGDDWYAVVTDDRRILILDAATGALRQEVAITP